MTSHWQIGFLGPDGSHSHQASQQLQGVLSVPELSLKSFSTFRTLLEAVHNRQVSLGVLPIENALEGSVVEVMEALGLQKYALQPIAEFTVPVLHCLIQQAAGPVTTVRSHPQALAQCRETLRRLFGEDLQFEATASTSEAVRSLAERPVAGQAAIGTQAAAARYGLQVTHRDISDAPGNLTRFLLLAPASQRDEAASCLGLAANQPAKTSFCLRILDRPGTLVDLLTIFRDEHVNLSKIESRPSKKRLGEYLFYIDAEGDLTGGRYEGLLTRIREQASYLQVLGPYACLGAL